MLNKKFILPSAISFTGFLFLVSMDSVIKILGETYSVLQLLFLNALFSLIPLFFFIYKNHGIHFYKNQNYTFQFIRGIVHTIGFLFVLKGVLLLPLSVVYPVLFTSPLMLLVMSHFFLSDNINIVRVLAILTGFLGVVISAEPFGTNTVSILGVVFVFLGAFCIAITHLITRKYNYLTSSYSAAFFSMVVSVVVFLFSINFHFEYMNLSDLLLSMLGGVFAGLGISAVIYGSRTLPSSVFGLTSYVQIIFGVLLGWIIFRQLPTFYNYIGITIVIAAGFILFYFDKSENDN
tara:strand:+ start:447 stop:1319 length:873 start_codon:yes stop_codon:yes gene_type:complete